MILQTKQENSFILITNVKNYLQLNQTMVREICMIGSQTLDTP